METKVRKRELMLLKKIISGGQTGADQGGLTAAKELNLKTGGWMPNTFRTETGPRPDLAKLYSLQEHSSYSYAHRTKSNVIWSDGTLIFGINSSPGCKLTSQFCRIYSKPYYLFTWSCRSIWQWPTWSLAAENFLDWLEKEKIEVLNVAGNREEKNPGIFEAVKLFLITAIKE